MKRIKGVLTACCVCIVCLLLLTACSAKLSAPTSFRLDEDTLTLHWNKVKQATGYVIEIGDLKVTTRETNYSLENLKPGEYVIKVRAIDHNEEYGESDFAEYRFTREEESGLSYKLVGNSYTLVGLGDATGDIVMEDYYRGKPVTSISKAALRRRGEITSFVVGKNVTTIEENAFYACSALTSITLPEGLTTIGEGAFQSCINLTTIVIPDSVKALKDYTFSMCKSLKNITLGSGVETIGGYTFSDCAALESIVIPNATQTVGEYAFSGCVELNDVTFGSNVKTIGNYAFYSCSKLKSVQLNDKLEQMGEGAFHSSGLTSVSLPDSVVSIGNGAFDACASLATVHLGEGLQYIGHDAFRNTVLMVTCKEDVVVCDNWILGVKNKELVNYVVPENVIGIANSAFMSCKLQKIELSNVRYIGEYAFYKCANLMNVLSGNELLEIHNWAFAYCEMMDLVELGNKLLYIRDNVFFNCTRLADINIDLPKSLVEMGSNVFKYTQIYTLCTTPVVYVDDWVVGILDNTSFKETSLNPGTRGIANYAFSRAPFLDGWLDLPDSLEIIGRAAFYNNPYLQTIYLPVGLKYIGDYAFMGCQNVLFDNCQLTIPMGCEYVGNSAFRNCTMLVGLYIPGSVKYVGNYAFKGCTNLGMSSIPAGDEGYYLMGEILLCEGIETIGIQAFHSCSGLYSITLPNSLKELGTRAFYKCTGLQELKIGTGLKEIPEYTFYDCASLMEVSIPGNVKSIGKYAFRGCISMQKITLAEGVERVEDYAFIRCENVDHLILADSVTYIGNFAFRGMTDLKSVYLNENLTYIGKLAFYGSKNATFYYAGAAIPETWEMRWNATYIPVVMNAVFSDDNGYIVSWTSAASDLLNVSTHNQLVAPTRSGYSFVGWTTVQGSEDAEYTSLSDVPAGTTVYSVWTEAVEEEIPQLPTDSKTGDNTAN